ncbi:uncharacterized protein DEA37_0003858 [Paragonimus westermani]|uniref:Sugar phosphate transporter domain-containing protein n=1 Tax=Paragonimus westermani TaxID=34504 RepID=A0A5J4NAD7_9TREM|nr:uncharacterized protein DEA37_0003858 [Paragonimus westermani]
MLALLFPITVGAIWGCTNVLMKYSKTSLQFIFYLLLNQCGSVLFVWGLSDLSLASAVPLANAVTLMVSALLAFCFCDERTGKSGTVSVNISAYLNCRVHRPHTALYWSIPA